VHKIFDQLLHAGVSWSFIVGACMLTASAISRAASHALAVARLKRASCAVCGVLPRFANNRRRRFVLDTSRCLSTDQRERDSVHLTDVESRRSIYQSAGKIEKSIDTVKLAVAGNGIILAAKLGAYCITGSSSMLAETVHSFVDCGNQYLLLKGLRSAGSAPDKLHQYG
jgi:Cation efflux family